MPTVNANKHTAHDLQLAGQMRREDYKTIKHMDKATLAAYLSRVWKRGYDAGYQAAVKSVAPQLREAAELKAANKEAKSWETPCGMSEGKVRRISSAS